MNKNLETKKIKCPHCGKDTVYSPQNEFRPFCSERCKLIDLGQWASENYKIPSKETSSDALKMDADSPLQDSHDSNETWKH